MHDPCLQCRPAPTARKRARPRPRARRIRPRTARYAHRDARAPGQIQRADEERLRDDGDEDAGYALVALQQQADRQRARAEEEGGPVGATLANRHADHAQILQRPAAVDEESSSLRSVCRPGIQRRQSAGSEPRAGRATRSDGVPVRGMSGGLIGWGLIVSSIGVGDTRSAADSAPADQPVEQRLPVQLVDGIDTIGVE